MCWRFVPLLAALFLASAVPSRAETLRARFLGNEAFEIGDGQTTLLTDFPYRSGAFGYMEYDPGELRKRPRSICLITHAHADHFEPSLAERIGCRVVGPPSVVLRVPREKAVAADRTVRLFGLAITPVRTAHGHVEHLSYLVEWKGLRLYFAGDTESAAELRRHGSLDALFVSPWLLQSALSADALPGSARVIVYHHRVGERVSPCPKCVVPRQGQILEISGPRVQERPVNPKPA
jgi:Beta-lactamase superfamily domain